MHAARCFKFVVFLFLFLFFNKKDWPELCGSAGKESAYNAGDMGSIPGLGRSHGEGKGYPLQYSGLENAMDCIVHRVAKSRTRLSDFHFQQSATCVYSNRKFVPSRCCVNTGVPHTETRRSPHTKRFFFSLF